MWPFIILVSFFYGITGNTITLYKPYFENNTFRSFTFDDNLCYSSFLKPDILRGTWKLNNTVMTTKVPILEASSLKQRDSLNLININFITPFANTSHRIMVKAYFYGNNAHYKTFYTSLYAYSHRQIKVLTLFSKTTAKDYLNTTTLSLNRLLCETDNVFKRWIKFSKNRVLYGSSVLKIGGFYWKTMNAYYGISGIITGNKISTDVYIPVSSPLRPFYDVWINLSPLRLYIERDLKYDIKDGSSHINNHGILTFTPEGLFSALWLTRGTKDTTFGSMFLIKPSPVIGGGAIITANKNTSRTSLILSSEQSFYNKEIQFSLFLKFDNMKYLYYSVEILLFRNLVLRKLKSENGDFIGIFVRLIN